MAIRYFQFVAWEKWYPRKDYKSLPWVKVSSRFFEDPKLDDSSFEDKAILLWLLCQAAQQNLGSGMVRLHASFMKASLQLRRSFSVPSWVASMVQRGVIIEIIHENTYVSRSQELRVKNKREDPPFIPPRDETGNGLERGRDVETILKIAIKGKDLNRVEAEEDLPF